MNLYCTHRHTYIYIYIYSASEFIFSLLFSFFIHSHFDYWFILCFLVFQFSFFFPFLPSFLFFLHHHLISFFYSLQDLPTSFNLYLSDGKSLQISMTLLSILDDFYHSLVKMVSILFLNFSLPIFFSRFLGTIPRAQTVIGITVTFVSSAFFTAL